MEYYNSTSAYDLSLFQPRPQRPINKSKTAAVNTSAKKRTPASSAKPSGAKKSADELRAEQEKRRGLHQKLQWVIITAFLIASFSVLISYRDSANSLTQQLADANKQLTELQQDYEAYRIEFDTKMSDAMVEEYATNVLGMQKRQNSQTEYVTMAGSDVFELNLEGSENWFEKNIVEKLFK